MPGPSLRDIEHTLRLLWMDRKSRESFLDDEQTKSKKGAVAAPDDLLAQIDAEGVRLYAGLLTYGHHDLMLSVYPGCAKLLDDHFSDAVENYLEKFPPEHYNLNQAARRFPEYLTKYGERWIKKFPYIVELADYEWIELEMMEKDVSITKFPHELLSTPEQFEKLAPVVNPALLIKKYKYPIPSVVDHLEDDCCLPRDIEPADTYMAIYRDPDTHRCRFMELGEVAVQLVEAARQEPVSYRDLLSTAVACSASPDPQKPVLEFLELVETLQSAGLFVGSQPLNTRQK
jgi:uncharacterized protein